MDQYNNALGRGYGDNTPSPSVLAQNAEDAVRQNTAIVNPSDPGNPQYEGPSPTPDSDDLDDLAGAPSELGDDPFDPPLPTTKPPVPPWALGPQAGFPDSEDEQSPLVIDLDGDGIDLTEFDSATTTFFDIDNDGSAEQTAWIAANQDGLLARDLNEDGVINNSGELFGTATVDGFAVLAQLDSNGDLVIDQYDDAGDKLVIWKDVDGDAYTDEGELLTLASQGIVSISLTDVRASTDVIEGNPISHTSTVTKTGGTTASIVDAWFVYDNVNSFYDQDYTLDIRTLFLPTLRGFGTLADLHIAMSLDEDLLDMVQEFYVNFDLSDFGDLGAIDTAIQGILYRWAGVHEVDPDSRGEYMDGQQLGFMEAFMGRGWFSIRGFADPFQRGSEILHETWDDLYATLKAQLLFQAGAKALFDSETVFNPFLGDFEGDRLLDQDAIEALVPLASAPGVDPVEFWLSVALMLQGVKAFEDFTTDENTWLQDAIDDSTSLVEWADIKEMSEESPSVNTQYGIGSESDVLIGDDNTDDTLFGYSGDDLLRGKDGNDNLDGGDGNDILDAGPGGDFVYGGNGDDTYIYSEGNHVYAEYNGFGTSGNETIYFTTGIEFSDLSFVWNNTNSLMIIVADRGTIELQYQIGVWWAPSFETIAFEDDPTTYDLYDLALTAIGTDAGEYINSAYLTNPVSTVYALAGDDSIGASGTTIVDAGAGNDTISLGNGGTLIFSPGFDTMGIGGSYTIEIPEEYDANDVTLLRVNPSNSWNDVLILVEGLGQLQLGSVFNFGQTVEQITFANGIDSAIDLHSAEILFAGTNGNESFLSHSYNSFYTKDNTFLFSAGHDTINDYNGTDDKIVFGAAYNPGNIELYHLNNELIIGDAFGNSTTVTYHFLRENDYYFIENLVFNSGTVVDLMSIEIETRGTEEADDIHGIVARDASDNDVIYGYGGNDYITAYGGADIIDAGSGNDNVSAYDDYLGDIVHLGEGNDAFYSSGAAADDLVFGEQGDDTIAAHGGADIVHGGTGADNIDGGAGNDTLNGDAGNDSIWGGTGHDTIYGGDDDDLLDGADDNDTVYGGAGADDVRGNYGDDILVGGDGDDILNGWVGIDTASYANALAAITASLVSGTATGEGSDTFTSIENLTGSAYADTLTGDGNANVLIGDAGADTLTGAAGNDTLEGGTGNDTLDGGDGTDTVRYANAASAVTVNLSTGTATGGDGSDTLTAIENVVGSAYADTLTGDVGANILTGNDGNDILTGNDGDDTLIGGAGNDTLTGGNGTDTVDYSADTSRAYIHMQNGFAYQGWTGSGTNGTYMDTISGIERVIGTAYDDYIVGRTSSTLTDIIYAGAGNDSVNGSNGYNIIYGEDGNDDIRLYQNGGELYGGAGNDVLYGTNIGDILDGGDGNDTIQAYRGNDTILGGAGVDLIIATGDAQIDGGDGSDEVRFEVEDNDGYSITVNLTTGALSNSNGAIGSIANVQHVRGTNQADTMTGNEENNHLIANGGDDTLYGLDGADLLYGYAGNDVLYGGDGNDNSLWSNGVKLYDAGLYGGDGNDILYGEAGNDRLTGDAGNDVLYGGDGNDLMYGSDGNDTLYAGAGADDLYGNAGVDTFIFDDLTQTGYDTLWDYTDGAGGDVLDISDLLEEYDPLTETLSDFVSVSLYSGHTIIKVDQDGTDTDHAMTSVVWLRGAGNAGDLNNLITDGNLVV